MLKGQRVLSEKWILGFARALNVTPEELIGIKRDFGVEDPEHRAIHRRVQALLDRGMERAVERSLDVLEMLELKRDDRRRHRSSRVIPIRPTGSGDNSSSEN